MSKKGFLLAMVSMAFWGLAFVLPLFVTSFSSVEIAVGRFFVYGTASLVALVVYAMRGGTFPSRALWSRALLFSLTGFLLFYTLLVIGIKTLGGPMATMVMGLLPVCVSMYGNWRNQEFPLSLFLLPVAVIFTGLALIHGRDVLYSERQILEMGLGLSAVFGAVGCWCHYAVHNGRFLKANPQVRPELWSAFIGVFCLIGSLLLAFGYSWATQQPLKVFSVLTQRHELIAFFVVSLGLGLLASYLSTLFWNQASLLLPMSLLGQLVVFEILFGLFYVYLKEQTLPSPWEASGVALVLGGIILSFVRVRRARLLAAQ